MGLGSAGNISTCVCGVYVCMFRDRLWDEGFTQLPVDGELELLLRPGPGPGQGPVLWPIIWGWTSPGKSH